MMGNEIVQRVVRYRSRIKMNSYKFVVGWKKVVGMILFPDGFFRSRWMVFGEQDGG